MREEIGYRDASLACDQFFVVFEPFHQALKYLCSFDFNIRIKFFGKYPSLAAVAKVVWVMRK